MNIDFSDLIKLYNDLAGSSFCFLIKAEDGGELLGKSDELSHKNEEIINLSFAELAGKGSKLKNSEQFSFIEKLKKVFKFKNAFINPVCNIDGINYYLIDLSPQPENILKHNPHLQTIINSITTELRLQHELFEKYDLVSSRIDAVIYSYNIQKKKYHFISGSAKKILDLTEDEIVNHPIKLVRRVYPQYYTAYKRFIAKLLRGEHASVDYEYKIKLGGDKFLRHVAEPIMFEGKVDRVVGVISDITQEKEMINRLKRSEKRFGLLINTAIDFIFSLNGFGYLIQVNENGANALGYKTEEMLGKHFLDFAADYQKNDITKSFQEMLSSKSTIHFEIDLLHKLNKPIKFEFLATPLIENDEITGMLGIGRDITRRRKNEETIERLKQKLKETKRLVEIERDRAKQQITILEEINLLKNEFISNVSHELRTPLASIVGFAETLASDEDLPRELISEFSNIILTEGKRLARFIEDILDFSELESGGANLQKEEFNIVTVLKELAKKVEKEFNAQKISFTSLIPDAEIIIFADKEKLIKAFNTIFENTLRFTKSGDNVSLVIQDFLKEVEIIISDDGNGISESDLELLFDKFHSAGSTNAKTPTAGIALSLVKQIFEHHKGLLQVKSSIGEGTTFIIRLPKNK
jgi:PAS domain S-box-containing protein